MKKLGKVACLLLLAAFGPAVATASVSVSVSPTSVHVQPDAQAQFNAVVSGASSDVVVWSLSGSACSGYTCGQISGTGLYTAPSTAPPSNVVTVTATSLADINASASAAVIIGQKSDVAVSVSPTVATVAPGQQQRFSDVVSGTTLTAVTWSLTGSGCSGSACGELSHDGIYLAPAAMPNPAKVTVTATSVADPTVSASAVVTIAEPFALSAASSTITLTPGHGGTDLITIGPVNGFSGNVTFSVSGFPSGVDYAFDPAVSNTYTFFVVYVPPGASGGSYPLTINGTSGSATASTNITLVIKAPVAVTVSPLTAKVVTGSQQQFTATVANASNTAVSWSLAGSGCMGSSCGTITASGLYTAPSAVPSPATVSVTATSVADPTKSATGTVTIIPPVTVSVAPANAKLFVGGQLQFTATVLGTSNTGVLWSVAGSGCNGSACGTITTSGLYTAPAAAPTPSQITVTATSVADSSKSGSASLSIASTLSINVAPSIAQVTIGASQQFTATVVGVSNTSVSWSVIGKGCSGSACGTVSADGLYFAPATVPNPAEVYVTATSVADPKLSSTATINVVLPVTLSLSPTTATVTAGTDKQFTATVSGSTDTDVSWTVTGAGCSGATCGVITSSGLYTAPTSTPSPAQVTIKAAAVADASSYRTAKVTIAAPITISISPSTASVFGGSYLQLTASVSGTTDESVSWKVSGKGCSAAACGTITSTGLYVAPGAVPSPAQVTVTATSSADSSKSASAVLTILVPVVVTISPSSTQVSVGGHRQFTATVTSETNSGVSWSVEGSGCSGSSCGRINSSGLYTAPDTIPSPPQVTVKAMSVADSAKSASATVTIVPPVVVSISPDDAVVAVNGQQQFRAIAGGSATSAVDWSLSGGGCAGSACGNISSTGLYTAPASVPAQSTVIVTATSQVDASQSASAVVTVAGNSNAKLQGRYAFNFSGLDSSGVYVATGSFNADGNGNLTSGVEDVDSTAGPKANLPFTGTYEVNNNNQGRLTFATSAGTHTYSFALTSGGNKGRLISFDSLGIRGSGVLDQQRTTSFDLAALKGQYVLSLAGFDNLGDHIGMLALFDFDGMGNVVGGSVDVNDGGRILSTLASVTGVYRIDSTGRGTLNLSIPGFPGGTLDLVFNAVSADQLLLVSASPAGSGVPVLGGAAELQSGAPFLTSNFSGATVFSLAGQKDNVSQVLVGRIVFDGVSQPTVRFDQNTGGTVLEDNVFTGAYALGVNGSGSLNLDSSDGLTKTWDMYAIGPNHAYLMDVSSAEVAMGELKPQSTEPPFGNIDIAGSYLLGSGTPQVYGATLYSGVTNFDGVKTVTGSRDVSLSSTLSSGISLKGVYSMMSPSNDGQGTLMLASPSGETFSLWVTSATEALGVETDASNTQPVVLYFEQ